MRFIPMVGVALALSGCESSTPQDAMAQQATAAGYKIDGIPVYEQPRWTTNVRVPGCRASVTLVGNKTLESDSPTSFTVVSVGGVPMSKLSPGTDTKNMSAGSLKTLTGVKPELNCT